VNVISIAEAKVLAETLPEGERIRVGITADGVPLSIFCGHVIADVRAGSRVRLDG
jgi:hypothetical protein